jgi:SAM-dependent methyltransferase
MASLPEPLTFFASKPASEDRMWVEEMSSVASFCNGNGLDPGAGGRTFSAETLRMDVLPSRSPQVLGDAHRLPFREAHFDFVVTSHLLEHLDDTRGVLAEWLRVVRVGGHVCSILPNTTYTRGQNSDPTPHLHEWSPSDFVRKILGFDRDAARWWFEARGPLDWCDASLVWCDEACPRWSFSFVLERTG